MEIFTIVLLAIGYLVMAVITSLAYAYFDSSKVTRDSPGFMLGIGLFCPVFAPVGLLYLTFGRGTVWLYQKISED